jgi:Mn-dependent DtxR family transcriptional regulator
MNATIDRQMDALLCSYYRHRDEGPLTIEELERTYSRIEPATLAAVGARLERAGLIRPVPAGGHVITEAGIEAYLTD